MLSSKCAALGLDPIKLADAAVGLYMASCQLRHAEPRLTARDYVHRDHLSREGQFLYDLVMGRTEEMKENYGEPSSAMLEAPAPPSSPTRPRELGFGRMKYRAKKLSP